MRPLSGVILYASCRPEAAGRAVLHLAAVGAYSLHLSQQQKSTLAWILLPVVLIWQVNGIYLAALAKIGVALFWAADFCQWIVLPGLLLVVLAKKATLFPKHYGFDTAAIRWQRSIVGTLAVFATTGAAFFLARNISWQLLGHPAGFFSFPGVFPSGVMGTAIWVYSAITAGVVESIFFIALPWLLYHNVRAAPSRVEFTMLAALVFAVAHWEQGPHVVIGAFFSHLFACFWFFRFGTLWPVAGGHMLVDLVAFS